MRRSRELATVVTIALSAGCQVISVQSRAPSDLGCPENAITIEQVGLGSTYRAKGCGNEATYTCTGEYGVDCVREAAIQSSAPPAPVAQSSAPPPAAESSELRYGTHETHGEPQDGPAPTGAAGFSFGSALDADVSACTGAGYAWATKTEGVFLCSGPPAKVGFDAVVELRFCEEALCRLDVVSRPKDGKWVKRFGDIRGMLEERYGHPTSTKSIYPSDCRYEEQRCMAEGAMGVFLVWRWKTRQTIELAMGKLEGEPAIRVSYRAAGKDEGPAL